MIVMILIMIGDHIEIADHLKENATKIEDILGEIIQVKMEDPLMVEGTP